MENIDCASVVPEPIESPPERSPQVVQTYIAKKIRGKTVVEIGTRSGDGMRCFQAFAHEAVAIELDESYCRKLENTLDGEKVRVVCHDYRTTIEDIDGDVYTWWQQSKLRNEGALRWLKRMQSKGKVCSSARALVVFDENWKADMRSYDRLRGNFESVVKLDFDEYGLCHQQWKRMHTAAKTRNEIGMSTNLITPLYSHGPMYTHYF